MGKATIQDQIEIEEMFNKNNIHKVIIEDLAESDVVIYKLTEACSTIKEYYQNTSFYTSKENRWSHILNNSDYSLYAIVRDLFVSTLYLPTTQNIQAVVGRVAGKLDFEDYFDSVKTLSEFAVFMAKEDLFDIIPARESESGYISIKPRYFLSEDTLELFEFVAFMPPMAVPPKIVKSNMDNSHYTYEDSLILNAGINHHNKPLALDVINIANHVAWSIDLNVLNDINELDVVTDFKHKQAKENYERMCNTSTHIYSLLLAFDNKFYLTHKYDKRGRLYSVGYQVHLQAAEYKRALMNFHTKEEINGVNW